MGDHHPYNATAHKFSWGHTIYHELAHCDPVIAGFAVEDSAYRACQAAKLAFQNGCSPPKNPLWTPYKWNNENDGPAASLTNADSYAFLASGADDDCDMFSRENITDLTQGTPEVIRLDPIDRTDGTYNDREPINPRPESTPPEDPPTPAVPYVIKDLPSGLATPFAPGEAEAYFATYQAGDSSSTTLATSTNNPTASSSILTPSVSCSCTWKVLFDEFEISGKDFPTDKLDLDGKAGDGMKKQLGGCGLLTAYNFETLTNDSSGVQWKATGKLPIGTKACVGRDVQSAGGNSPGKCTGAG